MQKKIASYFIGICFSLVICLSGIGFFVSMDNSDASTSTYGGVTDPQVLAAGEFHSLALVSGKIYAWGRGNYGQLGNGATANKTSPVQVGTETNWVSVYAGANSSYAINNLGELWAWGLNTNGQLGIGNTTNQNTPVRVGNKSNWVACEPGSIHTLAINDLGELWAWGSNSNGRLGDGTTTQKTSPVRIGTKTNWVSISAGYIQSFAINDLGELWAWGGNAYGAIGDGTTSHKTSPVRIGSDSNWVSASAGGTTYAAAKGYHSLAINNLGELFATGGNGNYQLGYANGAQGNSTSYTFKKIGTTTNWVNFSAGDEHSLSVHKDGSLWAWGKGENGRLGIGTSPARAFHQRVGTETNWVSVAAGGTHSLAMNNIGQVFAFGKSEYGQLGLGNGTSQARPVQLTTINLGFSVASPNSGASYTVSAPSITRASAGDTYTFTVTRTSGTGDIVLGLSKNGTLALTSTDGNKFTYTVSNVTGQITANDFTVGAFDAALPSGDGYTLSLPTDTVDNALAFTVTVESGYSIQDIRLEPSKGTLVLTSAVGETYTFTISNITDTILVSDLNISVHEI